MIAVISSVLVPAETIPETESVPEMTEAGEELAEEEVPSAAIISMADRVKDIAWPYYFKGEELGIQSADNGRFYTDHRTGHALMVREKSLEVAQALQASLTRGGLGGQAEEGRIAFAGPVDTMVLEAAALCHDTGMCGSGYAMVDVLDENGNTLKDESGKTLYEKYEDGLYVMAPEDNTNFSQVRTYHPLNSSMYVLANRKEFLAAGYTDAQIDQIAVECMTHSKSNSGVRDLNSRADWTECFDRLDALVYAWNQDHEEDPIFFDRKPFEEDDTLLGMTAAGALCLRVGDVSRDSGPEAEAQSGEKVYVDRSTLDDKGGSIPAEVENALITIGENGDPVPDLKSRQVHAGEQNISSNHTFVNLNGGMTHEITVVDGHSAPRCTQQAVDDHLGEFYSARDEQFDVSIVFLNFAEEDYDFFVSSWEDFRIQAAQDYPTITIHYPWD